MDKKIEFCFKGNRTYVHGTDIYNKMLEFLKNDEIQQTNFDLSFHGVSKKNMELSEKKPDDEECLKFVCKYLDKDNNKKVLYGIESNETINCKYPYPEEDIYMLSELNLKEQEIILDKSSSYTFIENTVALNKFLLEKLFPDVKGKWYFTRLQLKEIPNSEIYPLKILFKSNFNFKLTKSEILKDNKLIGFIYFSLV